jgi:uncharacterized membrane protein
MTNKPSSPTRGGDSTALLLGFMTGLRSATPPAGVAGAQKWGWLQPEGVFAKSGTDAARALLTLGAAGELVADKLPFTPSRLQTPSLIVRAKLGAAAAMVAGSDRRNGTPWMRSALLGGVGAVLGSYAGYHFRVGLTSKLVQQPEERGSSPVPAQIGVALVEDALTVLGTLWVLRGARGKQQDV